MAFIYRSVRIGTDCCYVGRTKNTVRGRWTSHLADLRKCTHPSPHFQNTWNKHGEDAFAWEVLEECDDSVMVEREQHYMDKESEEVIARRKASLLATMVVKGKQRWVHRGDEEKKISISDQVPDGWTPGRQPKIGIMGRSRIGETRSITARENMRAAQLAFNAARVAAGIPHHNSRP